MGHAGHPERADMATLFKRPDKVGLPPGTLVHVGPKKSKHVKITVLRYGPDDVHEEQTTDVEQCLKLQRDDGVIWINVDGIHKVDVIRKLGDHFGLHPLILEDIVHTEQRPKLEDYGDCVYAVVKTLSRNEEIGAIQAEQVSLILGQGFVLSFPERQGDTFNLIRARIRANRGRVRNMGADYLFYCLVDSIVDSYFSICEAFSQRLEDVEEQVITSPDPQTTRLVHGLKRDAILLRQALGPLREVINGLLTGKSPLVTEATRVYLRDACDHIVQVIEAIDSFHDVLAGTLDIYLSGLSNRMHDVVKVLAIVITIFVPLSFVAGVYGMNFDALPRLQWGWGYPAILLLMLLATGGVIFYFFKKKWI